MLEAHDLAARRGDLTLFSGLSFTVSPGHALVVTGANGTGKTTLLRILAGLTEPAAGRVSWQGEDVAPFAQRLREDAGFAGHAPALNDELTAEENLASLVHLAGGNHDTATIRDALASVALERQQALPARVLSQGQRRRIGLARLALLDRPLWLLDEPATALDAAGIGVLAGLLARCLAAGAVVVAATHQALDLPPGRVATLALS